jgi:hypothetical protein
LLLGTQTGSYPLFGFSPYSNFSQLPDWLQTTVNFSESVNDFQSGNFNYSSLMKDLKTCLFDAALPAITDDLNPLTPGPPDIAENALTSASQWQYNNSLNYAGQGLMYASKSSVFRGMMGVSQKLGEAADAMPMVALDIALIKGVGAEMTECQ